MTRTAVENAVRGWLVLVGADGGVPNPGSAVIFADQDFTRPALPYLVVRILTHDGQVGEDEDLVDIAAQWSPRGQRTDTVSVSAYGETAAAWLDRAVFMLRAPSVLRAMDTSGITVRPLGPTTNLAELLDDKTEARAVRDFAVDYTREASDEVEDLVELEQVVHTDELGDRTLTITEVL